MTMLSPPPVLTDHSSPLQALPHFNPCPVPAPEAFRNLVRNSVDDILVLHPEGSQKIAARYINTILSTDPTIKNTRSVTYTTHTDTAANSGNKIILIMSDPLDPTIKDAFFKMPNISRFIDHHYENTQGTNGRRLYTIGMSSEDITKLKFQNSASTNPNTELALDATTSKFRRFLQSDKVRSVLVNALGPAGTNISQVGQKYIDELKIQHKAKLIVHPSGIEPLQYAEMARSQLAPGVVPLHIECAVYYQMGELYNRRKEEMVFADHYYFPLDEMQLAMKNKHLLLKREPLRIASHPSPQGLVSNLVDSEKATLVQSASNATAADMVVAGIADCCITTGKACETRGLISIKKFGCPIMLFTVGCSLPWLSFKSGTSEKED